MTIQNIDNQIKLQRTKLNIASDDDQRTSAQKRIKILQYKREIERIKELIDQLHRN
jgi:hypothetical protein